MDELILKEGLKFARRWRDFGGVRRAAARRWRDFGGVRTAAARRWRDLGGVWTAAALAAAALASGCGEVREDAGDAGDAGGGGGSDAGGLDAGGATDAGSDAGPAAQILVAPSEEDFGRVLIETEGDVASMTIVNVGRGPSGELGVSLDAEGEAAEDSFSLEEECSGRSLAEGEECTLDAAFAPVAPGELEVGVRVSAEAIEGDSVASLRGEGVEPSGQILEVGIADFEFDPEEETIELGTTVRWENRDGILHTVTSGSPDGDAGELFESGSLEEGETFEFTFEETGEFSYFCSFHETAEVGAIAVE